MRSFLSRHQPEVNGVLSGFDRLRFRGTLLLVANKPQQQPSSPPAPPTLANSPEWQHKLAQKTNV